MWVTRVTRCVHPSCSNGSPLQKPELAETLRAQPSHRLAQGHRGKTVLLRGPTLGGEDLESGPESLLPDNSLTLSTTIQRQQNPKQQKLGEAERHRQLPSKKTRNPGLEGGLSLVLDKCKRGSHFSLCVSPCPLQRWQNSCMSAKDFRINSCVLL